jgi:hypothetical protein
MMLKLPKLDPSEAPEGGKTMIKGLEQLDADELNYLHAMIDADPYRTASDLFPDQSDSRVVVTRKIGQWAINRRTALEFAAEEKPEIALIFKKVCHRIWNELPDYARRLKVTIEQAGRC